jgi:hypothetical protein
MTTRSIAPLGSTKSSESTPKDAQSPTITPVSVEPAEDEDRFIRRVPLPLGIKSPIGAIFGAVKRNWRDMLEIFARADLGPDDPRALFIAAWNELTPSRRKSVTPEEICDMIGVSSGRMFGLFCEASLEVEGLASQLVLSLSHRNLVHTSLKFALRRDGFKDRELLMKSSGFLPTARGSSISLNASSSANALSANQAPPASTRGDENLASMEDDTLELTDIIRGQGSGERRSPSEFVGNMPGGDT